MVEYLKLRVWLQIVFASVALAISPVYSGEGHISIIDYQDSEQLLSINIVAPATGGGKLYLNTDGILSELRRFTRVGDHKLVIHLPCNEFKGRDYLLYKTGDVTLSQPLNRVSCTSNSTQRQLPRIIYSNAGCIIEPKGTTLWRVGSLLAEKNGYSVYQNMYAVFLSNRHHFVDEDITRMQDSLLLCPSEETIASLDKRHVAEMFQEAEAFRLANNMQEGAPAGSEEANVPDEGGEQLVQVISPVEVGFAETAPVKEVVEQEAGAGQLAMASADRDAVDNDMAADANAVADEKIEGGEHLAQVTSPADAVSADAVVEMEADSEHLAMASAAMGAGDKGQAANAVADVKSDGGEQLAQVTVLAEVAKQEHPIVDMTLAVISGGDKDAVPKLVIAIDGEKQEGHLNIVPGCYIEPNNKTLWRVGLALNKLNGHTVYQNMYAVFAVNPKAFPSGNVNHMLNQKLRCPSAREVTKYTTRESKALMKLDLPG